MRPLVFFFALGLGLSVSSFADEKPRGGHQVLVLSDAAPGAEEQFRASPGKPVHYVIIGNTELKLGESMAGVEMPPLSIVETEVVKALASQGFVRTQVGGPVPALCLLIVWGDLNFAPTEQRDAAYYEKERDRPTMEALMGFKRYDDGPSLLPPPLISADHQQVMLSAQDDRLYVSIAALDALALRNKVRRLVWRTNMIIDGRNKLADVLPVMLASGAPLFGRDQKRPSFIGDKARNATVEIGDLKVVPEAAPVKPEIDTKK